MRPKLPAFALALLIFILGCQKSLVQPLKALATPTTPEAGLAVPTFAGGNQAIDVAATATLILTYTHADATTLVASSGTSAGAPTGLTVSTTGGVSCSGVVIASPTTTGATIEISGCTGDGTVLVNVDAATASNTAGETNLASGQRTILVQNTLPTAVLAVNNAIVPTTNGANTITATFNSLVKDLSPTNANGEFVISGCGVQPTVAISTGTVAGHSVATATLSGGTCADGVTVNVNFHLEQVTNLAGNLGSAGSNPAAAIYDIDTTVPTASFAAATYPGAQGAIKTADNAGLVLTLTNTASQTLTASSGTTSSPPSGLAISLTGTASCSSVAITSPTLTGANVTVSGCTGDGTVVVNASANIATSGAGLTNSASATRTILVENMPPTATFGTVPAAGSGGSNLIDINFSSLVTALSSTNAGGEIVISGCTGTQPTAAISMSVNGSGNSLATLSISGGTCVTGETVTVELHLENISDLAANAGLVGSNPTPVTYLVP